MGRTTMPVIRGTKIIAIREDGSGSNDWSSGATVAQSFDLITLYGLTCHSGAVRKDVVPLCLLSILCLTMSMSWQETCLQHARNVWHSISLFNGCMFIVTSITG